MNRVRLDVQPGSEWVVPFAQKKLRDLRAFASSLGLKFSLKRFYINGITLTIVYNFYGLDHIRTESGGFFAIARYFTTSFLNAQALYLKNNFEASRLFLVTSYADAWMEYDGSGAIALAKSASGSMFNDGMFNDEMFNVPSAAVIIIGPNRTIVGDPIFFAGAMNGGSPTRVTIPSAGLTQIYHMNDEGGVWTIKVYDLESAARTDHVIPSAIASGAWRQWAGICRHTDKRLGNVVMRSNAGVTTVWPSKLIDGVWTDYAIPFPDVGLYAALVAPIGNPDYQLEGVAIAGDDMYFVLAAPAGVVGSDYSGLTMLLYRNGALALNLGTLLLYSALGVPTTHTNASFAIQAYQAYLHADAEGTALLVSAWAATGTTEPHDGAVWLIVAGSAQLIASTLGGASHPVKPLGLGVTRDGSKFAVTKGTEAFFYELQGGTPTLVATVTISKNLFSASQPGVVHQWWYNRKTGNFAFLDHESTPNKLYLVKPTGETLIGSFTTPVVETVEGVEYTFQEIVARGTVSLAADQL